MQRIGIYGGAFNPPHLGHIRGAEFACKALGLSKLLMIPTFSSPHKKMPEDSPSVDQRLELVRLSMQQYAWAEVSDIELCRGGISYTWQTVRQIAQAYPEAELVLLMGTDMFLSFSTWVHPEEILQRCSLGVFYRGNPGEEEQIAQKKAELEQQGATVYLISNPVTEISSTQLRRLLVFRCGEEFLAPAAAEYIRENHLYGTGRNYRNLPMEELEKVVVNLLKPNRVKHVLGVRDTAEQLARRYGEDPVNAARAGILHDITKALDGPLQLTLCRGYGKVLDKFSMENPKTLHALTGSLVAREIFGENEQVVEAIRTHTTGKANMNLLQKIIYVADYMEPSRSFPGVDRLRELAFSDIDSALMLGLQMTLDLLREQGREISPRSEEALLYLEQSKKG